MSVGAIWIVLTVLFEFGFGSAVEGLAWGEMLEPYDVAKGNVWILVLLWIAAGPATVRAVEGECVVDPTIVSRLVGRARREGPWQALPVDERRVVALVADGRSDVAIAREFGLALCEVDRRLRSLFAKLGLTGSPDDMRRVVAVLEYLRSTH